MDGAGRETDYPFTTPGFILRGYLADPRRTFLDLEYTSYKLLAAADGKFEKALITADDVGTPRVLHRRP